MADELQTRAEAVMVKLETRFGLAATYTKKGTPTVAADGAITASDTSIACTLVPARMTSDDMAIAGLSEVEQSLHVFKGRASVLGMDVSDNDQVTIGVVTYSIVPPARLDPLRVTWRLLARRIL